MREMLLGSKLVLERITQNDVQGIVKLLQTEKDSNLVDALVNMCTFEGSANLRLQHIIISAFFKTNAASNVLMPMRLTTEGLIEISYKGTPMPLANFFEIAARRDKDVFMALLRLKEAIAAGKNSVAIKMLILDLKLISLDLCLAGIKDATLPPGTRAQFCKIMNTLFLDTVHIDINPARMIVMFDSVPSATKSSAVVIDVTAKKIGQIAPLNYVPSLHYNQDTDLPKYPQFAELNQFISEFLDSCCQQQVADSAALDGLMSSVLVLLDSLFNLGVYNQDGAIEKLLPALLSVLDGRSGADKGGLEAITSTMALRFVRDEHSSLKIDTKTQICNILNKVLEWRLKNRISKVISVWKSDWTNAKSHSNIISVIVS